MPRELLYVEVAQAMHADPERVLEWPEQVFEDVVMKLRSDAREAAAAANRRGHR
ncbi:MAG: hypothetical protein AB7G21_14245 [Dehalococcoidia bacterium]